MVQFLVFQLLRASCTVAMETTALRALVCHVGGGRSVGNGFKKYAWPDRSTHDNPEPAPAFCGREGPGQSLDMRSG